MKKNCMAFEGDASISLANNYLFKIDEGELHVEASDGSLFVASDDNDEIIGLLKLEDGRVLTASKDGALKFWNNRGKKIAECNEHTLEVVYVCEVKSQFETHLVSLSKNEKFVIQSSQYRILGTIEIGISKLNRFDYLSNDAGLYILTPKDGLVFFNWTGKEFFSFKKLNEPVNVIRKLDNDYYLTDSSKYSSLFGISLWDNSGDLIKRDIGQEFGFSSVDSVIELGDGYFAVITKRKTVLVFDSEGKKYAEHSSKEGISKAIQSFSADSQKARKDRDTRKDILNYPHFNNPTHTTFRKHDSRKKVSETLETLKKKSDEERMVWDFFNRPFIPRIFRVLEKEQRNTNKSIRAFKKQADVNKEAISELSDKINARSFIFRLWRVLVSVIVAITVVMVLDVMDYVSLPETIRSFITRPMEQELILFGFFLLFVHLYTIYSRFKKRKEQQGKKETLENNNKVLDLLTISFTLAINDIEVYRSSLVNQIPVFKSSGLYDGGKVQQYFERIIKEKIEPVGLAECGIDKADIVYHKNEAIILNDWSLIQNKDTYAEGKIKQVDENDHLYNEHAFFPMKGQKMLFAVQYLQFIFLTDDKLDVFTTFYDFVEDKFISKQSYAFFYKDVTNFSRKDIAKPILFGEGDERSINSNAVEVTLSVSSGESIKLTIQNSETMDEIMKHAAEKIHGEGANLDQYIEDLRCEITEIEQDDSVDETSRKQRVEMLQLEIETSQNKSSQDSIEDLSQKANQAINNIRSQINRYKTIEA